MNLLITIYSMKLQFKEDNNLNLNSSVNYTDFPPKKNYEEKFKNLKIKHKELKKKYKEIEDNQDCSLVLSNSAIYNVDEYKSIEKLQKLANQNELLSQQNKSLKDEKDYLSNLTIKQMQEITEYKFKIRSLQTQYSNMEELYQDMKKNSEKDPMPYIKYKTQTDEIKEAHAAEIYQYKISSQHLTNIIISHQKNIEKLELKIKDLMEQLKKEKNSNQQINLCSQQCKELIQYKINELEAQIKKTRLLENQLKDNRERLIKTQEELDILKPQYQFAIEENTNLYKEIEKLDLEHKEFLKIIQFKYDENINSLNNKRIEENNNQNTLNNSIKEFLIDINKNLHVIINNNQNDNDNKNILLLQKTIIESENLIKKL